MNEITLPETMAVDPWLAMIERAARDPNIDVGKMVSLYELSERARAARAEQAFEAAMAAARGEFKPVVKRRQVSHETQGGGIKSYAYEGLDDVAAMVDPIIAKHGLSYRYESSQRAREVTVTCIIAHRDGHSVRINLSMNEDDSGRKNPAQSIGSAITYLQRYTLKLGFGLAATRDDDAQSAGQSAPLEDDPVIDPDQVAYIEQRIKETNVAPDVFLRVMKVASIDRMTASQYKRALVKFEQKEADMRKAEPHG